MPRRQVIFQASNYYHVYNRGNNREPIFFERENYIYFLRQLRNHLIINNGLDIIAYCLMPNHYHLLVYLKTNDFSKLMQRFSLSYTKAINQRYQRVGSLFQGRFQAIHVDKEEYLLHLTRYIHLNPVSANLVQKAEDWEFSSYPEYINLRRGSLPKIDRVMSQFQSAEDYRYFLEDSISEELIRHLRFED